MEEFGVPGKDCPLPADMSFARVDLIASGGRAGQHRERIAARRHLLQLTPEPLRPYANSRIDETGFEARLAAGHPGEPASCLAPDPSALAMTLPQWGLPGADLLRLFRAFCRWARAHRAHAALAGWSRSILVTRDEKYSEHEARIKSEPGCG
jgi:uncharacterized protein YjiS (DUF1127 family)